MLDIILYTQGKKGFSLIIKSTGMKKKYQIGVQKAHNIISDHVVQS
jgi:hypothetical protein